MGIASRIADVTEKLGADYPTGGIQYNLGKLEAAAESGGGGSFPAGGDCTLGYSTGVDALYDVYIGNNQNIGAEQSQGVIFYTTVAGGQITCPAGLYVHCIAAMGSGVTSEMGAPRIEYVIIPDEENPTVITPISAQLLEQQPDSPIAYDIVFKLPDIPTNSHSVVLLKMYNGGNNS